jgi:ferritin-like metal-binding protein YciE
MILDAEQQGLQAYPQMLEVVQHEELRQSMQTHMQQTQQQVEQLQQLMQQQGGQSQQGDQRCISMQALLQEAQQMVGQIQDPDTRDAFVICAAQSIEHHEIAAYGTARAWASQLGRDQDVQVLEQILDQEKQTDMLLTQLAERRVNQEAAAS